MVNENNPDIYISAIWVSLYCKQFIKEQSDQCL